jgi:SAM-dependent methyltransferase
VIVPAAPDDVLAFYGAGKERDRLDRGEGKLEFVRAKEILGRYLEPGSAVADIGGGVGRYAAWLAGEGHRVELVEPVQLHVELARELAGSPPAFGVRLADARALPFGSAAFDAVLLFGPLYHLGEERDRQLALHEALRVCRPGGLVFAIAISRFALLFAHLRRGDIADERVFANLTTEIASGRRAPSDARASTFPDAYFHLPSELIRELESVGLAVEELFGVEGPGWLARDFDALWGDPAGREHLLELARAVESVPELRAASVHLFAVARTPASA